MMFAYTHPASNRKELHLPLYQLHANEMTAEEKKLFAFSNQSSRRRGDIKEASFFNYTVFSVDTSEDKGLSLDEFRRHYYEVHRQRYRKHLRQEEKLRKDEEKTQDMLTVPSKNPNCEGVPVSVSQPPPETWQTLENLLMLYKSGMLILSTFVVLCGLGYG